MDEKVRDFVLQLSPTSSAITYALSNEGFGEVHELHLPKNLILAMVAGISSVSKPGLEQNEMFAMGSVQMIASAEETFKTTSGNGNYGTLDQLAEQKLVVKEMFDKYGYKFDVTIS